MIDFFIHPTVQKYALHDPLNKFKLEIDYSEKSIIEIKRYSIELLN